MSTPVHIAVVDDEPDITLLLSQYFQMQGYRVTRLSTGKDLLALMATDAPALVMLDLGLPDEDGLAIARTIRERWHCGLMILTGRGDSVDKIVGLEVGADDYVTKPFELRELLARVRALLRRLAPSAEPIVHAGAPGRPEVIAFEQWRLNLPARRLTSEDGAEVFLTSGEFELLKLFAENRGRVLSRDFLVEHTRGREPGPFDRTIDVQVGRLRRKLERDPETPRIFKSVRGVGYVFLASTSPL